MIDYLHLNPLRKGIVTSAADWRWSSARWYLERVPGPLAIDPLPAEWVDADIPDG
jgi:putative transposase